MAVGPGKIPRRLWAARLLIVECGSSAERCRLLYAVGAVRCLFFSVATARQLRGADKQQKTPSAAFALAFFVVQAAANRAAIVGCVGGRAMVLYRMY